MPPLSPEEYGPGRQIERNGDTLDVLDTISGASGQQFVIVATEETEGIAALVPVSLLREEDSEFTAVDEEERQERRRQAEEEKAAQEEQDREDFARWQAENQGNQPPAPTPSP